MERLWSFGSELSEKVVDLQSCRYSRSVETLYFSWNGGWDKTKKEGITPVLEYDLASSEARVYGDVRELGERAGETDYHHEDTVLQSKV